MAIGALNIAGTLDNDGGRINAGGGVQLTTVTGIANDGGHLGLRELNITQGELSNNGGELTVTDGAHVHAQRIANDGGRFEVGGALDLQAATISNRAGTISHSGTGDARVQVGTFDNSDGKLMTNAARVDVSGDVIVNERGRIEHAGNAGFTLTAGTLRGSQGVVITNGAATLKADTADHRGGTLSAAQLRLDANDFDNRGGTLVATGADGNTLAATGTLDNGDGGTIASNGNLTISAGTLGNAGGTVQQAGTDNTLAINAATLQGAGGTLTSNGALTLTGTTTNLRDGSTSARRIDIDTGRLVTAGGKLTATGAAALSISARDGMDNSAGSIIAAGADASGIRVENRLDNTAGTLASGGALRVQADTLINRDTRSAEGETASTGIQAATLDVQAAQIDNHHGQISAADTASVKATTLDNTSGSVTAANTLTIDATTIVGSDGTLGSNGALDLTSQTIDLRGGTTFAKSVHIDTDTLITAGGTLSATGTDTLGIAARDVLDNTAGTIASNGAIALDVGTTDSGTCSDGRVHVRGDGCGVLSNANGVISAAGSDASRITATGRLDNTAGLMAASGALELTAGALINRDTQAAESDDGQSAPPAPGKGIQARSLAVTSHIVDNRNGQMSATDTVSLKAATLDNTNGSVTAAGAVAIDATTLSGSGGTIGSYGTLSLTGQITDLSGATTFARTVRIDTGTLVNAGGKLSAMGTDALRINARDLLDNTRGTLAGNGEIDLTVGTTSSDACGDATVHMQGDGCGMLTNSGGVISAAGADVSRITATGGLDNGAGLVAASGALALNTAALINRDTRATVLTAAATGVWAEDLTITARTIDNNRGQLGANDALSVRAGTVDNTDGGITAGNTLTVNADSIAGPRGRLGTNGALTLIGNTIDLRAGATTARTITVDARELTTAEGTLTASGTGALRLNVRGRIDNRAGTIATNGALRVDAAALHNVDGTIRAAGADANDLRIAGRFDNTRGKLATAGATTVTMGDLLNAGGLVQAASDATLVLDASGHLDNSAGRVVANGAIDMMAQSLTNAGGTVQTQQAIAARVDGTLNNDGGLIVAGGDLTASASTLLNRDTRAPNAADPGTGAPPTPNGLMGQRVTLNADSIDNARGQVVANDALTLAGATQTGTTLNNTGGLLDGVGTTIISATALDNTGGQLAQRGAQGALALDVTGVLTNANGLIAAEGTGNVRAGTVDNRAGTVLGSHGLTLTGNGDLRNNGGTIRAGQGDDETTGADETVIGALTLRAGGALDNSDGLIDATGVAGLTATRIDNARGQVLTGQAASDTLGVSTVALNNQAGVIGTRGGDLTLHVADVDNRADGRLVAGRDLTFRANRVDNSGGTVFAGGNLGYDNASGTLVNTGGRFGAGGTASLTLANVSTTAGGRIQAGTVRLNTPMLDVSGGEVVGNTVYAQLATLTGAGRLYGAQLLDAAFSGDYTYGTGSTLASDVRLDLAVAGAFTNLGTLQTPGGLALSATSVTNQGIINASNADGGGYAHITAGSIDNRRGASLEGDELKLNASVISNTGDIVGDNVSLTADTLTNGQDLGNTLAAVNYGEGYIGASQSLDIRANRLANRDGDIFSAGDLSIGGRDAARAVEVANISGRIQAEGNASIAADAIVNDRRMLAAETYTLSAEEASALGSQRRFDEAYAGLGAAGQAELDRLTRMSPNAMTPVQRTRLGELLGQIGWAQVDHVSDAILAALNREIQRIARVEYGARDAYIVDNAGTAADNPAARIRQTDTYRTGQRVIDAQTSAASQIVSGGALTLDVGERLRNYASQIAAGGTLTIAGQSHDPATPDARIENLAIAGTYTGERETAAWVRDPTVPIRFLNGNGWHDDTAHFIATTTEAMTFAGPSLADATITAGGGISIEAGDVSNTAVTASSGPGAFAGGNLNGAGSMALGAANGAQAGRADAVDVAASDQIDGNAGPGSAQGGTLAGANGPGGAAGGTVTGGVRPATQAPQFIGTAERPLPGLVPADNGMFDLNADSNAKFLITTAPRFAQGGPWDGSNYLLAALRTDPNNIHKRLGDGYYEQRLINDQILQLTGRRTLNGGGDANAQYRALMDNAAATAGHLGLQMGAPLTTEQIAALDSDIVWLVEQEVNSQTVLVPVVYLSKATAERLAAQGALIDGDTLDINATGTVRNDGTLAASKGAWLSADKLINDGRIDGGAYTGIATRGDTVNRGRIEGNAVAIDAGGSVINAVRFDGINATAGVIQAGAGGLQIDAKRDVINQGQIASAGHGVISAGRDFVQNAATTSTSAVTGVRAVAGSLTTGGSAVVSAGRDVVLDQSGIKAGQHAVIDAGRDAKFTSSTVKAGGAIAVTAGRDIVADTVTDTASHTVRETVKEGKKKTTTTTTTTDETVRGSTFQASGNIAMVAETGSIDLTAATVRSDDGAVMLRVDKGGVNLRAGHETDSVTQDVASKKKNTLSKTTTSSHSEVRDTYAVGTTISGKTVSVAGDSILVSGSNVASDHGTTLVARNNVTIENDYDTHEESHSNSRTKSGVFGNGGASVTAGKQKQTFESQETSTYAVGSTVGSLKGNTTVIANDGGVHVQGSTVASPEGSVTLLGKSVNVEEAYNTTTYREKTGFKQSGVTLSASAPVVDAALAAGSSARTVGQSKDDRVNAMAAANTAYDAYQAGSAVAGAMQSGGQSASISLTYGQQKSETELNATSREAVGSAIKGKNVAIVATGAGDASTIRLSGSDAYGQDSTTLYADGNIDVLAAQSTHEQTSSNSSSGWNVGVAASYGSGGGAIGVTAGGNAGKGNSDGKTVTHTNSHVGSGGTTNVTSGGTLTVKGGQIGGEQVAVDVKNLTIESLQDTQTYDSKQQNAEAQVTAGYGVSVSGSYNQSKINSNYASVNQQSGIIAGDGGYSIKVEDRTNLKGGIVTSTAAAEAAGRNLLRTGTLTISDIENHADYEGSSFGISGRASVNGQGEKGEHQLAQGSSDGKAGGTAVNKSVGFGRDDDHQKSTTHSGINTGNILITDAAGQAATGKSIDHIKDAVATATTLDTLAAKSSALVNKFDAAKVQSELDLQTQVTQSFDQNRQDAKAEIYAHADAKRDEAREIRMANGGRDTDESTQLDQEAGSLQDKAKWLDIVAMAAYAGPDVSNLVVGETITQADLARRAATAPSKLVVQRCDAGGQNCVAREVDLKDVEIVDGRIYVFNNGIFNEEDKALANGAKQNSDPANDQGVYHILNPRTGSPVAEMLYAGYDKLNDLMGSALPLTSAEAMNQKIWGVAGSKGGIVEATNHSRGGMTYNNAMADYERLGKQNVPIGNTYFFGAAANAQEAADTAHVISGGRSDIYQATHPTDLVGKLPWWILGGNPPTGENNDGSFPSSHSSYTRSVPPAGTFIGGVNMRELTDRTWGPGNYSAPVEVPPSEKAKDKLQNLAGDK
ncbi:hemagglutinin repeat-containing protein [Lysobacter sp. TAF61]|uniref:hemagglutinin repeat-containing protein n=1 Tax=Lysobacter sp. TAF61 TaxID=3233072 RepID=UPI003F9AB436